MTEEEIYKIITKDVFKYPLLNQIFAIRDNRYKINNKSICVNGYISLDTIEKVIQLQNENEQLNNRDTSRLSEIGRLRTKNNYLENEIKYYYIPKDKIEKIKNKNIGQYMNFYREIEELLEED